MAKLWRYPQCMDFRGNTLVVQGQGAYMLCTKQKDSYRNNFCASLKSHERHKNLAQTFPVYSIYIASCW